MRALKGVTPLALRTTATFSSNLKTKPNHHSFPLISPHFALGLCVLAPSYDGVTVLSVSFVNGLSDYFHFTQLKTALFVLPITAGGFDDRGGRHGGQGNLSSAALTMILVSEWKSHILFMPLIQLKTALYWTACILVLS